VVLRHLAPCLAWAVIRFATLVSPVVLVRAVVSGVRLPSIRHVAIALMHGMDERRSAESSHLGLGVAITISVIVFAGLLLPAIRRCGGWTCRKPHLLARTRSRPRPAATTIATTQAGTAVSRGQAARAMSIFGR